MALQLDIATRTDRGLVRSQNEDTALVTPIADGTLLAVCDGMGGSAGGEVASRHAAETLARAVARRAAVGWTPLSHVVREALREASDAVRSLAAERRELTGMGTTATVCALREAELVLGQVGDSRAYLFRDGELTQLTRDQSLATYLVESGQLPAADARACEFRHVILQALGTTSELEVDVGSLALRRGDIVLVCSDGLWDVVSHDAIAAVLARAADAASACDELVRGALAEGGPDNVTCVIARVVATPEAPTRSSVDSRPTRPSGALARLRGLFGNRSE